MKKIYKYAPNLKTYSQPGLTRFGKISSLTAGGTGAMVENMPGGGGPMMGVNRRS